MYFVLDKIKMANILTSFKSQRFTTVSSETDAIWNEDGLNLKSVSIHNSKTFCWTWHLQSVHVPARLIVNYRNHYVWSKILKRILISHQSTRIDVQGIDPACVCGYLRYQRPFLMVEYSNVTWPVTPDNIILVDTHCRTGWSARFRVNI